MPNLFADLPSNAVSISAVDGVNVSEGQQRNLVNNSIRGLAAMVKTNFAASANTITASAGLFNLASISAGDYVLMAPPSGGSITSFGAASDGLQKLLESTGTTLLRNGASLSVQGGASLTIVAGDVVWCRRDQSVWKAKIWRGDGSPVKSDITSTATGTLLTLTSTDAGATQGPNLDLLRDSATPAVSDIIGSIRFRGRDSAGNLETYFELNGQIDDPTNTSEDSTVYFTTKNAGASYFWQMGSGALFALSGSLTNKGPGTVNATGLYVGGHGTVAQVVSSTNVTYQTLGTILPLDNTIPQIGEGDQIHSLAITPINASSILRFRYTGMIGATSVNTAVSAALFVGATANALTATAAFVPTTAFPVPVTFEYEESAASVNARTYTVRAGSALAGDAFLNGDSTSQKFGGVPMSVFTITEVLPQ